MIDPNFLQFASEDDKFKISLIPYFGYVYDTKYDLKRIIYERKILLSNMESILNNNCIIKIEKNNTHSKKLYLDGFKYHNEYKVIPLNNYSFKIIKIKNKKSIYKIIKQLSVIYIKRLKKKIKQKIKIIYNIKKSLKFINEDEINRIYLTPFKGYNINYNNEKEFNKLLFERSFIQKFYNTNIDINKLSRQEKKFIKSGFEFHPNHKIISNRWKFKIIKNTIFKKFYKKYCVIFKNIIYILINKKIKGERK